MQDQDTAFHERESDCEERVEKDGENHDANGEKSGMPCLEAICVVIESNEALNDSTYHEGDRG
jgi:hypothetical protein